MSQKTLQQGFFIIFATLVVHSGCFLTKRFFAKLKHVSKLHFKPRYFINNNNNLFCLILILEERLMRLPFLNHEMLVACLPMSPLWRPLGPRPRDRRSRPPGRLFTRHRSFTRPSLEGKLSPLWREDRSLNFIDASPPVKGTY